MKIATLDSLKRFFTNISTQLNNKVDKVSGKALSTNDFTDTDKANLDYLMNDLESLLAEV